MSPLVAQAAAPHPPPRLRAFGRPLDARPAPLCPEVTLWLLDAELDLEAECRDLSDCQPPPYWAFCWGGGQALARFVLDHPAEVRGRRVVDFGAGGGIAAIAAARAGARSVVAVDIDPDARAAVRENAVLNGVGVTTAEQVPAEWDVLLAADVLYEDSHLAQLTAWADRRHTVWLADPGRPSAPRIPIDPVASYAVTTHPDVDPPSRTAAVYRLPAA